MWRYSRGSCMELLGGGTDGHWLCDVVSVEHVLLDGVFCSCNGVCWKKGFDGQAYAHYR